MAVLEKFFQKPGHISKSEIAGICIGPIQTAILGFFLETDLEISLVQPKRPKFFLKALFLGK